MFEFLGQDFGIALAKRIEDVLANSVFRCTVKNQKGHGNAGPE